MRVAFLHARQNPIFAEIMIRSVRKHMPGIEILQLTDDDTPAIDGCTVIRKTWMKNPMVFKMSHLADLSGETIILDTDVIVQADLREVFEYPFDVALTKRKGPILDSNGVDVTKLMPYNCGVMWSRNPAFWKACVDWCAPDVGWYADQMAVANVSPMWETYVLDAEVWNYTPSSKHEDVSTKKAVHYKGLRKEWMYGAQSISD